MGGSSGCSRGCKRLQVVLLVGMYYVPSAQPPRTHLGATNARASAFYMLVVWDLKLQLQSRRFVFKKFQLFLAFLRVIVLDMHAMLWRASAV
jgi:hypothetical protein